MAKALLIIAVLIFFVSCRTSIETFQTSDSNKIGVKSNKFRGTIFKNSYQIENLFIAKTAIKSRFTPTKEDITIAEKLIREQIGNANKQHENQLGKHQYIDRNLNKYFRQYVGYINENDDRIIHINFHWDRIKLTDRIKGYWDNKQGYVSDYTIVFDGGYRHWSINVNLISKTIYGLSINGLG